MLFSGGNLKVGSKTSENSSQMAYQYNDSAIGIHIECILDDYMPSFFAAPSFGTCVG